MLLKGLLSDSDLKILSDNNIDINKKYVTREDFDELFSNLFKVSFEDIEQGERIYDIIKDSVEYKKIKGSDING